MTDEVTIAQDAEDIAPEVETTTEPTETVEAEQTIGDMAGDTQPAPRVVDEKVFVAEKKARKAAERRLKELEQLIAEGATTSEISDEISEFSEKYDIDPSFINDWESRIEKKLDAKYSSKLSEKEKADKFETKFSEAFTQALERGPEFKDIANVGVIKQLAQLPQNSHKTVSQLIEETYGNALTGKRTIETTQPGGGKDPEPLDLARAEKDIDYFNQVMADPKKKAKYNEYMLTKGF